VNRAVRWIAGNFARFVGTWLAAGSVFAGAMMISQGDGFTTPSSFTDILSVPFVLIAFVFMSLFVAAVGLVLFAPFVAPGLVLYLIALWSAGRAMPAPWRRRAAVGLSPLIPVLVFVGADWMSLEFSMLAGSAMYGAVVKLPP
jgi:hypothetical protein